MPYNLTVETEPEAKVARLTLTDDAGVQKGANLVRMAEHPLSLWEGLFDTRRHVDRFAFSTRDDEDQEITDERILSKLGRFLGATVLGPEIMAELTATRARRTLQVRIPGSGDDDPARDALAAAFARVPWEIAESETTGRTLMDHYLVIRVITDAMPDPHRDVLAAADAVNRGDEPLRVLFVFAEAPGDRPLAMRLEREELRELFAGTILPKKNVEIDLLCHGVTRSALKEQVRRKGGYHVVHWSGHGHQNLLSLTGEDGGRGSITGKELAALFENAGGFIPQLVFLSACLSGAFVDIRDWATLRAALLGERPDVKDAESPALDRIIREETGYTGTALDLLRSGVPQVVAMRYEVGDDYARELARQFYRRGLADGDRLDAADALTTARTDLRDDLEAARRLGPINHATPILFGHGGAFLTPRPARSKQMDALRPRPQPLLPGRLRELDPPPDFVGRGEVLTDLQARWLRAAETPVALIQGLAGLGKTAIAAEAIHLWHPRFDYVLAFQAKPTALALDEFFRTLDSRLTLCSAAYRGRCEASPYERIFLEPGGPLTGPERYDQIRVNLLEALRNEAVLIVIDNFETNLEDLIQDGACRCREAEWDRTLEFLRDELAGTSSRVLMTSRLRPAGLRTGALAIPLGPLPPKEAVLFVRTHPALRELLYSGEDEERLLRRLLDISRGHPLILNRLGVLADRPEDLEAALDQLTADGLSALPDIYTAGKTDADRRREHDYLEDVAGGSVDLLIRRLSPDARRLLWIITLANESVTGTMIEGIWGGRTVEDDTLKQFKQLLKLADSMPAEAREQIEQKLSELPPEFRAILEAEDDDGESPAPPVGPLLDELLASGLVHRETADAGTRPGVQAAAGAVYGFHELVRERIAGWMTAHPEETGGRTAEAVWIAYGDRYAASFRAFIDGGGEGAYEGAGEAGRRALTYMVRAGAFDRLGGFASSLVTGTRDPGLLKSVIGELKAVADTVPPGEARWSVRTYLADALRNSGQPDQSLTFYETAAAEAEAAGDWSDLGWIRGNWAIAFAMIGRLAEARDMQLKSADALRKAGRSEVDVISRELEALRIDVMGGRAEDALPEIDARLSRVREWWKAKKAGRPAPEAPNPEDLGRALVSGLDVSHQANHSLQNWEACLDRLTEIEETQREMGAGRHEIYIARFNQYGPLIKLGRLDEARRVVEECLAVFEKVDDLTMQAKALSALAHIWNERGDVDQAISLARQALSVTNRLPDPADRAISHLNLGNYLEKAGRIEDCGAHHLAAGIYDLVSGHHDPTWMGNLKYRIRRAAQSGGTYDLHRIADLTARPEFQPLDQFLTHFGVDRNGLQAEMDRLVAGAREEVLDE